MMKIPPKLLIMIKNDPSVSQPPKWPLDHDPQVTVFHCTEIPERLPRLQKVLTDKSELPKKEKELVALLDELETLGALQIGDARRLISSSKSFQDLRDNTCAVFAVHVVGVAIETLEDNVHISNNSKAWFFLASSMREVLRPPPAPGANEAYMEFASQHYDTVKAILEVKYGWLFKEMSEKCKDFFFAIFEREYLEIRNVGLKNLDSLLSQPDLSSFVFFAMPQGPEAQVN